MKKITDPTQLIKVMSEQDNVLYEYVDNKLHKLTRLVIMDMSFRVITRMIRNELLYYQKKTK